MIYSIGSIITVYIVCTLVDLVRQKTIEKLWIKFLDLFLDDIERKVRNSAKQICDRFMGIIDRYYL